MDSNCLVTNIPPNIFFRVQHNKETHTGGLEQLEDKWIMTELSFLDEQSL